MGKPRENPTHESILPILDWMGRQTPPLREADFLRDKLPGVSHGIWSNWKRRGVAAKEYTRVAHAIGLTTDQYRARIGLSSPYADLTPEAIAVAKDWMTMTQPIRQEWAESIKESAERARKSTVSDAKVEGAYYPERRRG